MRAAARSVVSIAVLCACIISVAGPAAARNVPGSPPWCKHHPKSTLSACRPTGGGPPPSTNITVSPNPIVETGNSDVYAVISVAVDPVYAEQTVEIVSGLGNRCVGGVLWTTDQGAFSGSTATATIDNDGNATFTVIGGACAAGSVQVIADVLAGANPTYTATFTIDPPAPSI
jgi:hypothetical protein